MNSEHESNEIRGLHIVVDLGASQYRMGTAEHDQAEPAVIGPTPKDTASIILALCDGVRGIANDWAQPVRAVSVGCPGLITDTGAVYKSLHIPLSGCDLRAELIARLGVDVSVLNDAKAQALGHPYASDSMFFITLGTGIGGALVDHGRLVAGAENFAGEVGHIPIFSSGQVCPCGEQDCLDAIASGWALTERLGPGWYDRELRGAQLEVIVTAGIAVGKAAALCAILMNPAVIVVAGHITINTHFRDGFLRGWTRRGWAKGSLEFVQDTWPLAFRGLTRLFT